MRHRRVTDQTPVNIDSSKQQLSTVTMTPSIIKTRVALEKGDSDRVLRKRVIAQPSPTQDEDQNNNEIRETETSPSPAVSSAAPYQIDDISYLINEREKVQVQPTKDSPSAACSATEDHSNWKAEIRWPDTIVQIFLHSGFLYGIYLLFFARLYSILWCECSILSLHTSDTPFQPPAIPFPQSSPSSCSQALGSRQVHTGYGRTTPTQPSGRCESF